MLAAYHGHAYTVRLILEHGGDANTANDRGQTPLAGAVFKGYPDVVPALVEAGADPDAGTPSARAAAQMFAPPGHPGAARLTRPPVHGSHPDPKEFPWKTSPGRGRHSGPLSSGSL